MLIQAFRAAETIGTGATDIFVRCHDHSALDSGEWYGTDRGCVKERRSPTIRPAPRYLSVRIRHPHSSHR